MEFHPFRTAGLGALAGGRRAFPFWRLAGALLVLMLAFAPSAPARASLLDCVEAAAPVDDATKLGELTTKVGLCMSQFADDPMAAVVMATLVALAAHGDIAPNTDQCNAAIDSVIGKALAKALLDILGENLTTGEQQALNSVLAGANLSALYDVLGPLELQLQCGCTVLGAPGAAAQIANDYLGKLEGCAQFFESIGDDLLTLLGDLGCVASFGIWCPEESCDGAPSSSDPEAWYWFCYGLPQNTTEACVNACEAANFGDRNCRGVLCGAGQQCGGDHHDRCVACPIIDKLDGGTHQVHSVAVVNQDGSCGCAYGYQPVYQQTAGGPILTDCSCAPPFQENAGICYCPKNTGMKNGICAPCGADEIYVGPSGDGCRPCNLEGYKPDPTHTKCVPACDPSKAQYFDGKSQTCKVCPAGETVVYDDPSAKNWIGHCVPTCLPGQVSAALHPNYCITCQHDSFAAYDDPNGSVGHCQACPDYTVSSAGATQCTPLVCGPNSYNDPNNTHECISCPTGQIYYPPTIVHTPGAGTQHNVEKVPGHCGCPEGTKQEGEVCQCPAGVLKAVGVAPGLCQCPAGAYVDTQTFACTCPIGSRLSSDGSECVRLQPGKVVPIPPGPSTHVTPAPKRRSHPEAETPAAPATVVGPPPLPGHRIVCPPGMAPGPFGMHCFPIRPGAGRAAPGHRIVCPPGMVPGPFGMRCFPRRQ